MKFIKDCPKTTAILLFAKSEKAQSISKLITCHKKQNQLLWKKMNEKALKIIRKTKIPYFISDESTQVGDTFGEKITNAINQVFAQGYQKVIVIGNDCVALQSDHLLLANANLLTHDLVLGADFNGGAYLIGITKHSFSADQFAGISWQTTSVFKELKILFSSKKTFFISSLNDCNTAFEFKKAIRKLSFSDVFKNLLLSLLHQRAGVNQYEPVLVSSKYNSLNLNKGSPSLLSNFA
jgi:hypothetical protein